MEYYATIKNAFDLCILTGKVLKKYQVKQNHNVIQFL